MLPIPAFNGNQFNNHWSDKQTTISKLQLVDHLEEVFLVKLLELVEQIRSSAALSWGVCLPKNRGHLDSRLLIIIYHFHQVLQVVTFFWVVWCVTFSGVFCDLRIHLSDQKVTWKKLEFTANIQATHWSYGSTNPFYPFWNNKNDWKKIAVFSRSGIHLLRRNTISITVCTMDGWATKFAPCKTISMAWRRRRRNFVPRCFFLSNPIRIQICSKRFPL